MEIYDACTFERELTANFKVIFFTPGMQSKQNWDHPYLIFQLVENKDDVPLLSWTNLRIPWESQNIGEEIFILKGEGNVEVTSCLFKNFGVTVHPTNYIRLIEEWRGNKVTET